MEHYKIFDKNFYKKCIDNYDEKKNYDTEIMKNTLTLKKTEVFLNSKEFLEKIAIIINYLSKENTNNFIENISRVYNINKYHKQLIFDPLFNIILPFYEKNIFNCNVQIIDFKVLTHLKGDHNQSINKSGAFLWHYDNHPQDIVNIILYLNDVDNEKDGGFQYISDKNNHICKFNFTDPAGNKNMEHFVNNNIDININTVTGKLGTLFCFDNNIVHRASPYLNKNRHAILLQIKPSLN